MHLIGYFDVSRMRDNPERDAVGVHGMAGYVARAEKWVSFERRWQKALDHYELEYFRMSEYETGHTRGEPPYCTWDLGKRIEVLKRFLKILADTAMVGTFNVILERDFDQLTPDERARFGQVYRHFAISCMAQTRRWLDSHGFNEPVEYVFESGDDGQGPFKGLMGEALKLEGFRERFRIRSVDFKGKTEALGLQAADFAAFEACKYVPHVLGRHGRPMRKSFEEIVKHVRHEGDFLDLEALHRALDVDPDMREAAERIVRDITRPSTRSTK